MTPGTSIAASTTYSWIGKNQPAGNTMTNQTSLVDLVAVGDAPATSPICARTIIFTIRHLRVR